MRVFFALLALLPAPSLAQNSRVSASPALSSSLLVKSGTAILASINVTSGASAGYVMVFDSATVPPDGAVAPQKCIPLAANTGIDLNWRASPLYFQTGAVVVFSTTGCFNKTASATAFISGDIR